MVSFRTAAVASVAVAFALPAAAQAKTKEMFPNAAKFSALTSPQQIQLLTAIEKTPFFLTVREHTLTGMFASPRHGGNFNKAGWKLIGFEDTLNFKAPFGYYDAPLKTGK